MKPFRVWGDDLFVVREDYAEIIHASTVAEACAIYARQEHSRASGETPHKVYGRGQDGVVHIFVVEEAKTISVRPQAQLRPRHLAPPDTASALTQADMLAAAILDAALDPDGESDVIHPIDKTEAAHLVYRARQYRHARMEPK